MWRAARIAATCSVALLLSATSSLAVQPPDLRRIVAYHPIHVKGGATSTYVGNGYTPAQIRGAYGIDQLYQQGITGGNPGQGKAAVIAIVDAYDAPTIWNDLSVFITQMGIASMHGLTAGDPCTISGGPHPCFVKICQTGSIVGPPAAAAASPLARGATGGHKGGKGGGGGGCTPGQDPTGGWELEASLDVEWAHAVAPDADIVLAEANSNSLGDLLTASNSAVAAGAHVVSMSWGAREFSLEFDYDSYFSHAGVTFVAASGDGGAGTIWPAVSPNVIAAGGTTLCLDAQGNRTTAGTVAFASSTCAGQPAHETAWSGSGGGDSIYETEPAYQTYFYANSYASFPNTGGFRATPDVALDANPSTGLAVYDTTPYSGETGWFQVGGTSAAAPAWAGLIALADYARMQSSKPTLSVSPGSSAGAPEYNAALPAVYGTDYFDIVYGSNGHAAGSGYDLVTGFGSAAANYLVLNLLNQ